ncbi:MAG: glycoside hydrolase family 15 protein [Patescibacteria group bacterium]
MTEKIKKIIAKSKEVILDSVLENGAIVAANADKPYYPRQAKDYHYVWPRDAAYICYAAQLLGIKNIQKPFYAWLESRPQDFKKQGKLFANYAVNGPMKIKQFQPDQAGTVLWSIHEFYKDGLAEAQNQEVLIRRLADGLADDWKGQYFFTNTVDLWEEGNRQTSTKVENNHTYSLAACARGLLCADQMIKGEKWKENANEMIKQIEEAYLAPQKTFVRNHGKIDDLNIDASLLGLVWPFAIIKPTDERIVNTVRQIEEKIVFDGGVHRYQFDYYDGEGSAQEGGGAWPILNFWLAIYFVLAGDIKKAKKYYDWVIDKIETDCFIPEQIFGDFRQGIKPLVWSHAMFVIASYYLGKLK